MPDLPAMPDRERDNPASLDYLNFDLSVEASATGYRARVFSSPAGEASATVQWAPADIAAAGGDLKQAGSLLFGAIFTGDVLTCLRRSLDLTDQAGQGLRIRLRLGDAPELANLPWEALHDRSSDRFLALSRETPLVRYLELPEPVRPLIVDPPLRVLAVIASPAELPPLHVTREWANLQGSLKDLTESGQVLVERLEPPTLPALQNHLREHSVHVLHYVGHGAFDEEAGQGVLFLEDQDGHASPLSGADLAAFLSDHRPLRLALLNACQAAQAGDRDPFGGVAQKLVQGGVPAVIAMRSAISDPAAIAFSHEFYAAVADASPVDAAMADARRAVYAVDGEAQEWATPVLFMRAPDGLLWQPPQRKRLRAVLLSPVGLLAVLPGLALVIALGAWLLFVPAQMPLNTFNVAFADFGQIDAAGNAGPSKDAANLSRWMFEEVRSEAANLPGDKPIVLWHDSMGLLEKRAGLSRIPGRTADERAQAAARLARGINAHMVVYGNLEFEQNPAAFVPEFYNSEVKREADDLVGRQELGAPISVQTPVDFNDQVTIAYLDANLKPKAQALVWLARGLAYDLAGQHDRAWAVFQEADKQLVDWGEDQGREILAYFRGREAVFLTYNEADAVRVFGSVEAALAEGERAFALAARIKEVYPRAHLGLGNVAYQRAQRALLGPPEARDAAVAATWLDQSVSEYRTALDEERAFPDSQVAPRARLALGNAYRLQGYTYLAGPAPDLEAARARFDAAIVEIEAWLAHAPSGQPRTLAQGYQMLGATFQQKAHTYYAGGDPAAARPWYERAQTAYTECARIADENFYDQTLRDIKVQSCEPNRGEMARIVKELETIP